MNVKGKFLFSALLLLLIGGGWWYWHRRSSVPSYQTTEVSRGDIRETVSASATLVASNEIDLNFEVAGRVRSIAVKEGDRVAAGEVIAVLESVELEGNVESAKAALDRARAETLANDDTVREAAEAERDSKLYHESVESLEDQKVSAANLAYQNAKDYEEDAESYYNQVVADHGAGSSEAKSAKLTLTAATNSRKSASEARETAEKNRDSATRYSRNSWDAARQKVKTLESSAQNVIETSAVRSAEAAYASAIANAEKAKVRAPVNGQVTKMNYSVGEVVGTSSSGSFGRLLSYDFLLEAKIPESDIAKIKTGQLADVSFDSFDANDALRAEVVEIEPDATVIQDVVYYIAKLRFSTPDARLKPGMSADVDLRIAERQGVLRIPARLLLEEKGVYSARVLLSDGRVETRNVSVGVRGDDGVIEVLSGLAEGDRVVSQEDR